MQTRAGRKLTQEVTSLHCAEAMSRILWYLVSLVLQTNVATCAFARPSPPRGVAEFESKFRPALFRPFSVLRIMSEITALTGKLLHLNIASDVSAAEKSSSRGSKLPTKSNSSLTTAGPSAAPSKQPTAKASGSSKETQRQAPTRQDDLATAPVQEEGDDGAAGVLADIGTYDGELENDERGLEVTGDAAEDLSLDSSISR